MEKPNEFPCKSAKKAMKCIVCLTSTLTSLNENVLVGISCLMRLTTTLEYFMALRQLSSSLRWYGVKSTWPRSPMGLNFM